MTVSVSETIQLPHGPTPILWRRSTRARRVSLRIDPRAAAVVVTLPMRTARSAGLRLLADHAGWVGSQMTALPPTLLFADGATIPVGGVPHRIRHRVEGRGGAWFEGGEIHVAGQAAFLAPRVTDLLRAEAGRRLGVLAAGIGARAALHPSRLIIRDPRSRWGSCAPDGTLMFNWRLVMAPPDVQHSVVAHELAHLRHMDHGPRFWQLVTALDPDGDGQVTWLRENGATLMRAGATV